MRHRNVNQLNLNESYEFNVIINTENGNFAGNLTLTQEKTILKIMGEQYNDRGYIGDIEYKSINCKNSSNTFYCFGLNLIKGESRFIDNPNISYFEYEYEVEFVIFLPGNYYKEPEISYINILSIDIGRWIGITKTQRNILNSYRGTILSVGEIDRHELKVDICNNDIFSIEIYYGYSARKSLTDFYTTMSFRPVLCMRFNSKSELHNCYKYLNEIYSLLFLIMGGDFDIEMVSLGTSSKEATLYYSRNKKMKGNRAILFPLGINQEMNENIPELPLGIFQRYFDLDENSRGIFHKYIRYKRMSNNEEKFLGYFRLLESALSRLYKSVVE